MSNVEIKVAHMASCTFFYPHNNFFLPNHCYIRTKIRSKTIEIDSSPAIQNYWIGFSKRTFKSLILQSSVRLFSFFEILFLIHTILSNKYDDEFPAKSNNPKLTCTFPLPDLSRSKTFQLFLLFKEMQRDKGAGKIRRISLIKRSE